MWFSFYEPLAFALGITLLGVVAFVHRHRSGTWTPWERAWHAASRQQRRRIRRAVQRGEAVRDPRDAALAVGLARRLRTGDASGLQLVWEAAPTFIPPLAALLVSLLAYGRVPEGVVVAFTAFSLFVVLARAYSGAVGRNAARAIEPNRRLAEQFEVPVLEDHGRPEAPRRSAASRLLFLLLASLVAVTAAVTEPRTSAAHRQAPPWTASADAACEAAAAGLRIGVPSSRADYRVLESSRLRLQRQFFRNLATLVPPQRRAWLQREVVAPRVRRIARELYALKAFGPGDLQEFRRRMRLARANEIENDLLVSSVGLKHCAALG